MNSGRSRTLSSSGSRHSSARPTNETTSTIAAAHANSQVGTGRTCLPTMPWALATAGEASAATRAKPPAPTASLPRAFIQMTSTAAIWVFVSSISTSKMPSIVAGILNSTVPPFVTSFITS